MEMSAAGPERDSGHVGSDDTTGVSLAIDANWRASELTGLLAALEATYNVFLALGLDQYSGGGNLGAIASDLANLVPGGGLVVPSMRFSSPGVVTLTGSGEIPHEVRGFLKDLETVGQRRKANKLDLQMRELEVAQARLSRRREEELDEVERTRRIREGELELARMRQEVMDRDLDLAAKQVQLTLQIFEARYGPDWRTVDGAQEQFDALLKSGSYLLKEFTEGRIGLPEPDEKGATGDGGF